jgi:hypothetical protein
VHCRGNGFHEILSRGLPGAQHFRGESIYNPAVGRPVQISSLKFAIIDSIPFPFNFHLPTLSTFFTSDFSAIPKMQSLILPFVLAAIASAQNVLQIPDGQIQAAGAFPQQVQPQPAQPQQPQYAVPTSGDNVAVATGYGPEADNLGTYCPPTEYSGQAPASELENGAIGTVPSSSAGAPVAASTPVVGVDTDSGYVTDTGYIANGAGDVPICVDLEGEKFGAGHGLAVFEGAASKHSSGCLVVLMLAAGAVAMGMM